MSGKTLLTAAWVEPVITPIVRDGGIVFADDRVIQVGPARLLAFSHPDAHRIDLGPAIILPGLVNAHTHLELSLHTPGDPPRSFVEWVTRVRATPPEATAVADGLQQCAKFGVTTIGDITNLPPVESELRIVSYREVRAMAQRRGNLMTMLDAAKAHNGISPHAPYSVEPEGFAACLKLANERCVALTTHLAEWPQEAEFLAKQTGMLRELWDQIRGWDQFVPRFEGGPIRFAKTIGLLDHNPVSLAHVNYCDDEELEILTNSQATVVVCPRTHRYFAHPPHRWRDMLDRGINVAVGTDSGASSPDLNLVDDLRLLHEIAPDVGARELWSMATSRGAMAVGMGGQVGRLAAGSNADFVVFDVTGDEPLREILENCILPREVWISGNKLTQIRPASPC